MREAFQQHLRPLDGKAHEVKGCEISYVHHRKGLRYLAHYDLRLAESGTGRESSQLVTGVIYSGDRTRQVWDSLRRSGQADAASDPAAVFAPFSYIRDLGMLVQVFPHDYRLPALPLLAAGPAPEIEAPLLASFGHGDWQTETWEVEPVRYRVLQRAILRLTVRARDSASDRVEERRFYAKVYLKGEKGANLGGEQTFELLRKLWENDGRQDSPSFTVGRPLAYLDDLRILLQDEAPGTPLGKVLRRGGAEAIPAVRRAAGALAALHLDEGISVPQHRLPQDEAVKLERGGEDVASALPDLGPMVEKLVGVAVAGLDDVPSAPTHGDCKPGHILLDGDDLALIDLDKFAMADPLVDVVHMLAKLEGAPESLLRREDPLAVSRVFAEEYFARVPAAWRARLPLHYAGALLKKAGTVCRSRPTDWAETAESLLLQAEDSLAGKIW